MFLTIFCSISMFFFMQLAPALYGLPIIEQTKKTLQAGLVSAIISLILSLCFAQCVNQVGQQGMDDIVIFLISQGLVAAIDGGFDLYLYSLLTAITALFLPQPPLPQPIGKRRSRRRRKPATIEDPEEGKPLALVQPATTPSSGSPPPLATAPASPSLPSSPSLRVSETILGHGTNNAVVFEGTFQGRAKAVKRYQRDLISLAVREVSILQESDDHPNVVRYFYHDQESDPKFFFIVLDLCPGSLADVIENRDTDVEVGDKRREEWKEILLGLDDRKAMKQIASGLRHLHGLNLVHRDIKPHNILISSSSSSNGPYRMQISDFGLSKKIDGNSDQSRFLSMAYGSIAHGTAGWMSPETLQCIDDELESLANGDTTMSSLATINASSSGTSNTTCPCLAKSVDIFALGCVFYYLLTRGGHPYGHRLNRELNIRSGNKDLSDIHSNNEAHDLITHMLHQQSSERLDIETCLLHPFFWDPTKRLGFLRDASDRFEIMSKDPMDSVLIRLERDAKSIIETDWRQTLDQSTDQILIKSLRKSRGYDNSVRDLLRALRNKRNHYQDLPEDVKIQLGSMPEGFLGYFSSRFPRLLVYVHEVVKETDLYVESMFSSYFELPEDQ